MRHALTFKTLQIYGTEANENTSATLQFSLLLSSHVTEFVDEEAEEQATQLAKYWEVLEFNMVVWIESAGSYDVINLFQLLHT